MPQRHDLVYEADPDADFVTIVSVNPFGMIVNDPGMPTVDIPPCEDPLNGYVTKRVSERTFTTDRGDVEGTYIDWPFTARRIASSILRGVPKKGFFAISNREIPTEGELAAARAELQEYARFALREANELWARYGKTQFLSNHHFWAATFLHQDMPWHRRYEEKQRCPECDNAVPIRAAKCACGVILNWPLAAKRGLLSDRQIEIGLKAGFLAPESLTGEPTDDEPEEEGKPRILSLEEIGSTAEEAEQFQSPVKYTATAKAEDDRPE